MKVGISFQKNWTLGCEYKGNMVATGAAIMPVLDRVKINTNYLYSHGNNCIYGHSNNLQRDRQFIDQAVDQEPHDNHAIHDSQDCRDLSTD